jgi:hypothetical protein
MLMLGNKLTLERNQLRTPNMRKSSGIPFKSKSNNKTIIFIIKVFLKFLKKKKLKYEIDKAIKKTLNTKSDNNF